MKRITLRRPILFTFLAVGLIIGFFVLRFILYLFSELVKSAYFNQQLKKSNYCSVATDCELIPSYISGSCSEFVNRSEVYKIIDLHKKLNLLVSFTTCLPTKPQPVCSRSKCSPKRLITKQFNQ